METSEAFLTGNPRSTAALIRTRQHKQPCSDLCADTIILATEWSQHLTLALRNAQEITSKWMGELNMFTMPNEGNGGGRGDPTHAYFEREGPWNFSSSFGHCRTTKPGAWCNFPAVEIKALPPQLLNVTNYTCVHSNIKKTNSLFLTPWLAKRSNSQT